MTSEILYALCAGLALLAAFGFLRAAKSRAEAAEWRSRADRAEAGAAAVTALEEGRLAEIASLRSRLVEADGLVAEAARLAAEVDAADAARDQMALDYERQSAVWRERLEEGRALAAALREELDGAIESHQDLKAELAAMQARSLSERRAFDEKITMMTEMHAEMQRSFKELSHSTLAEQSAAFTKSQLEKLELTLSPLREQVGFFEREFKSVQEQTLAERAALKAEIRLLTERSEAISAEAVNLTRALKGSSQKQGAWGEMILETILENSGLRAGEEYVTQNSQTNEDGQRLRPDVIVRLPGQKALIIDSKVSLNAYADYGAAQTELEQAEALKRHVMSLRAHIKGLSGKAYQNLDNRSVDYVILFVPIEGALSEGLRADPDITRYALESHITIATPTTLMMALRTVANVWAVERRNQNAEEIARRAGLVYDKLVGFLANMDKMGKALGQAQGAYDDAMGQLSRGKGNALSQIETLKSLGARTSKSLPVSFEGEELAIE